MILDCLEHIVSHIDDARTLARVACVNRACRQMTRAPEALSICVQSDVPKLCEWVICRVSRLKYLTIVGNAISWSAHWRTRNFVIAPHLTQVTILHPDQTTLSIASMEEFVPICPQLHTLRVMSGHDLHLGPSVSRYDIRHLELVGTDVILSMMLNTLECLRIFGNVSLPECFVTLDFQAIRDMQVPTSVMVFCQHLPRLEYLRLIWDGEFSVDFLHAPYLTRVDLVGGDDWDTSWLPPCVKTIRLHDGTITPDPSYHTHIDENDIITLQKRM